MSIAEVEEGDYVRVVLEGKVDESYSDGFYFTYEMGGQPYIPTNSHPAVKSVEKVPEPEPEWQVGDVVLDDFGTVYHRSSDGWRDTFPWCGQTHSDDFPERPLTLLVRDGKKVN